MTVHDLYSKRRKRELGQVPDVFTYEVPQPLRVQVIGIIDAIFADERMLQRQFYENLHSALAHEYGVFTLGLGSNDYVRMVDFFCKKATSEESLDFIELAFSIFRNWTMTRNEPYGVRSRALANAIPELDTRFLEHGVGYSFVDGKIIRKDSEILHKEVVLPTLHFLHQPIFKGPNEEYLRAHEHFRHGEHEECISDCLKALESTLKVICSEMGWDITGCDTAKRLLDICWNNHLLPDFLASQFTSVRNVLESGTPTVRNKVSGHGRGKETRKVPAYFSSYLLHLTGTSILLLGNAFAEKREQKASGDSV